MKTTICVIGKSGLHSDMYMCYFLLNPEDIKRLNVGATWIFKEGTEPA